MDTPEIEITFDSILCLSFLLPACSGTMLIFDSLVFSLVSKKETTISPHPLASLYHSTWSFCAEGADGTGCPKLLMLRSPRQNLIWDRVFLIYIQIYIWPWEIIPPRTKKASLRTLQFGNLRLTASSSNHWPQCQEFLARLLQGSQT